MKQAMKQVVAVMPWAYHTTKTASEGNLSIPTTFGRHGQVRGSGHEGCEVERIRECDFSISFPAISLLGCGTDRTTALVRMSPEYQDSPHRHIAPSDGKELRPDETIFERRQK